MSEEPRRVDSHPHLPLSARIQRAEAFSASASNGAGKPFRRANPNADHSRNAHHQVRIGRFVTAPLRRLPFLQSSRSSMRSEN